MSTENQEKQSQVVAVATAPVEEFEEGTAWLIEDTKQRTKKMAVIIGGVERVMNICAEGSQLLSERLNVVFTLPAEGLNLVDSCFVFIEKDNNSVFIPCHFSASNSKPDYLIDVIISNYYVDDFPVGFTNKDLANCLEGLASLKKFFGKTVAGRVRVSREVNVDAELIQHETLIIDYYIDSNFKTLADRPGPHTKDSFVVMEVIARGLESIKVPGGDKFINFLPFTGPANKKTAQKTSSINNKKLKAVDFGSRKAFSKKIIVADVDQFSAKTFKKASRN